MLKRSSFFEMQTFEEEGSDLGDVDMEALQDTFRASFVYDDAMTHFGFEVGDVNDNVIATHGPFLASDVDHVTYDGYPVIKWHVVSNHFNAGYVYRFRVVAADYDWTA